jgi:hypothetical protein
MRSRSFIRRSGLIEAQTTPIEGNGKHRSFSGQMQGNAAAAAALAADWVGAVAAGGLM